MIDGRNGMTDHSTLGLSAAVGRFAVAYVRKVCAQAHIGFSETSPGEDVLAIDGRIEYFYADVRVQIKGTTRKNLTRSNGKLIVPIEDSWREKWRRNGVPAYFILVLLERQVSDWFMYQKSETIAGAYALWVRMDDIGNDRNHLVLDRSERFTAKTIESWNRDLLTGFGEFDV